MPLTLGFDQSQLDNLTTNLANAYSEVQEAFVDAVNYVNYSTRKIVVQQLSQRLNCDRKEIESRVHVRRADRSISSASITVSSYPVPLRKFSSTQTAAGVIVQKYRGGSATFFAGAFGPNIPRLGRGVFKRSGTPRLPIESLPGVNLAEETQAAGIESNARVHAANVWQRTAIWREIPSFRALQS